jgi:hypothetical protein
MHRGRKEVLGSFPGDQQTDNIGFGDVTTVKYMYQPFNLAGDMQNTYLFERCSTK